MRSEYIRLIAEVDSVLSTIRGLWIDATTLAESERWRARLDQLLDERTAIQMAAAILDLHARAWETANPRWSIRHRPDILATLYTLGFDRNRPKPDPQSNAFGRSVAEATTRFSDMAPPPRGVPEPGGPGT